MTAMKLVPVEPTAEMEKVYFETSPTETLDDFYTAIIAAAPVPDDAVVRHMGLAITLNLRDRKGFRQLIDEIADDGTNLIDQIGDELARAAINAMMSEAGDG